MAHLSLGTAPVSWFLRGDKRCHLCLEDALHVAQGGSARPLRSLLGKVGNFMLGLEGGIQTGFSWVLEV